LTAEGTQRQLGRAPIPVEFVSLTEGQVIDAGDFTINCFRSAIDCSMKPPKQKDRRIDRRSFRWRLGLMRSTLL
jgi:hypothetical protein